MKKIQNAQIKGEYKNTVIDNEKLEVDFLLIQTAPYILQWKNGVKQKVTELQLKRFQQQYSWKTNF